MHVPKVNEENLLITPLEREEILFRLEKSALILIKWYKENGRELPWRERYSGNAEEDQKIPYHIWVSEIMLQQTRVEAVIPYYRRFLSAVPDIKSLACAEDQLLHKLWEGLGYYSRVRGLKKGAQQVMNNFGGQLPKDISLLKTISGIGEYTAGAIGSIAFGIREPAVDGNLLRVGARLLAAEGDISRMKVRRAFHDLLLETMNRFPSEIYPGDYNQAMMDLGAMVCIPQSPKCEACPICGFCLAFERDQAASFPVKAVKQEKRLEEKTVLVLISEGTVEVCRRPEKGLLAGMWEFPMLDGFWSLEEIRKLLAEKEIWPSRILALKDARHLFTHIEWKMKGFAVFCPKETIFPSEWEKADLETLEDTLPLASAVRVYKKAASELLQMETQPGKTLPQ